MYRIQQALILAAMMKLCSYLSSRNTRAKMLARYAPGPATKALRETMDLKAYEAKQMLLEAHKMHSSSGKFRGIGKYRRDSEWLMLQNRLDNLRKEYRQWRTP